MPGEPPMKSSSRKLALQILLLGGAGVALSFFLRAQAPVGENVSSFSAAQALLSDTQSPVGEVARADVTIVAFTDYRCPACRKAHPELHSAVVADGRSRVVYKDWPIFGPASERAARVAIASDIQGIYPAVHDALMRAPNLDERQLRSAIERSGGKWRQVQHDLTQHEAAIEDQLNRNRRQAFALSLQGTPGYLVGPILVRGAATERQFRQAIDQARQTQRS